MAFWLQNVQNTILGALIQLSIGVETYIKKKLEEINPCLIYSNMGWKEWNNLRKSLQSSAPINRIPTLIAELTKCKQYEGSRTIDFARAIEAFCLINSIESSTLKDLKTLKEYRNGVFHWKADAKSAFEISKLCLRVFLWLYDIIQKDIGHHIGGELNIIDPMLKKKKQLQRLHEYADERNEQGFNIQRRIFKHNRDFTVYFQTQSRLNGDVFIPKTVPWLQACPACSYESMELYQIGAKQDGVRGSRDVVAHCIRCDFCCSNKEYQEIRQEEYSSLIEIYDNSMGENN